MQNRTKKSLTINEDQDKAGVSRIQSTTKESNDSAIESIDTPVATPEMCHYCFDVIINELLGRDALPNHDERSSAFLQTIPNTMQCPLFVTWDKRVLSNKSSGSSGRRGSSDDSFRLRGCIGSLSPLKLCKALGDYALTSAFRDTRFDPVASHEIMQLKVWVSLLVKYEECDDCLDWEVGKHGIFITFMVDSNNYNVTYLPEVASSQGWTNKEAIESLVRKAGYRSKISDEFLAGIKCTRYQSSKQDLTYASYVILKGHDPVQAALHARELKPKKGGLRSWLNL